MKRRLFLTVIMTATLVCGTALAADIAGTYVVKDSDLEGEMIIKKSWTGYTAEINTYIPNSPPPGMWSGFAGKGTLKDNILIVSEDRNGHSLQISIKFTGNTATITEDGIKGDAGFFGGPSGGPEFSHTYKKKP